MTQPLSCLGAVIQMYHNDRLIQALDHHQCEAQRYLTLTVSPLVYLALSHVILTQTTVWLRMVWYFKTAHLHPTQDNCCRVLSTVHLQVIMASSLRVNGSRPGSGCMLTLGNLASLFFYPKDPVHPELVSSSWMTRQQFGA